MSLNHIQLTPSLLAGLYAQVLVETTVTNNVPNVAAIKYLGGNQKHILIVAESEQAAFLPDEDLSFLTNILAACKLSIADVAIVNYRHLHTIAYDLLIGQTESKWVLLFGIDPLAFGLPVHFPHFQIQPFGACTYLSAPALNQIEQDKTLKAKLWAGLKTLFGLQ